MTPRRFQLLLIALALVSIAAGIVLVRVLSRETARVAVARHEATAPAIVESVRAPERPLGGFLQGLRGHIAEPEPPVAEVEPPAPEAEPSPEVEGAISAAPGFVAPTPPARPRGLTAQDEGVVPVPPVRPRDPASLAPQEAPAPGAETPPPPEAPQLANVPLPPARPRDLPALEAVASAAAAPSPQQVANAPEAALRAAPENAFPPQEERPPARFGMGDQVFVRIFKQEGQLELWLKREGRYHLYKTYPICKWSGRLGPKVKEADYQSPEGFYSVSAKQLHPHSNYHRAFNVGYPNAFDRQNGRTGGLVMVHGNCKSVGCFAMTDPGIEEIYGFVDAALRAGQKEVPVHIFPFRMTEAAIAHETGGGWMAFVGGGAPQWGNFWRNLKEGYDLFEQTGEPPTAFACGDHYAFGAGGASCKRIAGW